MTFHIEVELGEIQSESRPNAGDSVEGESYTWKDGDRT